MLKQPLIGGNPQYSSHAVLCSAIAYAKGELQVVEQALKDADMHKDAIDFLVLHQANQRILDSAAQRLGVPSERVVSNLAGKRVPHYFFVCHSSACPMY